MFNEFRPMMCENYNRIKDFFCATPNCLIELERFITEIVNKTICDNIDEIICDYNEASYTNAFWAEYPPDDRGRAPVGDQIPWIEVGEQAIGHKLSRLISNKYAIREIGLPSGADNRFVLKSDKIAEITSNHTDRVFIFLDIKSVGPRDNFNHTVISPYQVSGDGIWNNPTKNLTNSAIVAQGRSASHIFYPAISPIYCMSDGTVAPTVHLFVKPIYKMLGLAQQGKAGQPLECIKVICVPNGLLLTISPNYLKTYPGLFFPGKDDSKKDPKKIRVRVSFDILQKIASWRVANFNC